MLSRAISTATIFEDPPTKVQRLEGEVKAANFEAQAAKDALGAHKQHASQVLANQTRAFSKTVDLVYDLKARLEALEVSAPTT